MSKSDFLKKHMGHPIFCVSCDDKESDCNCHDCEQWCEDCGIMSFQETQQ